MKLRVRGHFIQIKALMHKNKLQQIRILIQHKSNSFFLHKPDMMNKIMSIEGLNSEMKESTLKANREFDCYLIQLLKLPNNILL